jgi:hypothetical protein
VVRCRLATARADEAGRLELARDEAIEKQQRNKHLFVVSIIVVVAKYANIMLVAEKKLREAIDAKAELERRATELDAEQTLAHHSQEVVFVFVFRLFVWFVCV